MEVEGIPKQCSGGWGMVIPGQQGFSSMQGTENEVLLRLCCAVGNLPRSPQWGSGHPKTYPVMLGDGGGQVPGLHLVMLWGWGGTGIQPPVSNLQGLHLNPSWILVGRNCWPGSQSQAFLKSLWETPVLVDLGIPSGRCFHPRTQ